MKRSQSPLLAAGLGLALLSGLSNAQTADQDKSKENPPAKQAPSSGQRGKPGAKRGVYGPQPGGPGTRPGGTGPQTGATNTYPGAATSPYNRPVVRPNVPSTNSTAKPTTTSPTPTTSTTKPAGTSPTPATATAKPNGTSPTPVTTTAKPSGTSPTPATATAKPGTLPTPATATAKPRGTSPTPATATAKPSGTLPTPATVTAKPAAPPTSPTGLATGPSGALSPSRLPLVEKRRPDGIIQKQTPSGKVVEATKVDSKSGFKTTEQFSLTGRKEKEIAEKSDGTKSITQYDLGREKRTEVVHKDGTKENTEVHYNRNGDVRARETIKVDAKGAPIAKTVEVKNNLAVNNTTVVKNTTVINNNTTIVNNNTTIVREYRPRRYGYVYVPPPVVVAPVLYTGWYDPFWYAPPVVVGGPVVAITTHHFSFSWGWTADPWYAYHRAYWQPYPVYVAPSYWVTDWMVAGYLADRYAVVDSVEQTRREVALAREDADKAKEAAQKALDEAEKAKVAAQQAKDDAEKAKLIAQQTALESELAEARRLQKDAEDRAQKAETRVAKAEVTEAKQKELAASGKPNPNATPIDEGTKTALREQIEKTIAEKKVFAEQSAKGANPVLPDVSQALADSKHIYPVSKTTSVVLAKDSSPAGTLTTGDLLKVEPGQDFKDATENTFVTMRVMTSKGEDGEVAAGTLISVPLRDLQEFDNEFRAKLDQGLAEADKNKDQFKQLAQK